MLKNKTLLGDNSVKIKILPNFDSNLGSMALNLIQLRVTRKPEGLELE
jgi:hypothetical protein